MVCRPGVRNVTRISRLPSAKWRRQDCAGAARIRIVCAKLPLPDDVEYFLAHRIDDLDHAQHALERRAAVSTSLHGLFIEVDAGIAFAQSFGRLENLLFGVEIQLRRKPLVADVGDDAAVEIAEGEAVEQRLMGEGGDRQRVLVAARRNRRAGGDFAKALGARSARSTAAGAPPARCTPPSSRPEAKPVPEAVSVTWKSNPTSPSSRTSPPTAEKRMCAASNAGIDGGFRGRRGIQRGGNLFGRMTAERAAGFEPAS